MRLLAGINIYCEPPSFLDILVHDFVSQFYYDEG